MFIIGIDPHKGSHTAAVIDGDEQLVGELARHARIVDNAIGLLRFAAPFEPRTVGDRGRDRDSARCWRNSSSAPARPSLMCRRRSRRGRGCWTRAATTRPTAHDARSAAIVALRHRSLRAVALETITPRCCGCWRDRYHQLVAGRTRSICRLHALLCLIIQGGLPRRSVGRHGPPIALRRLRPTDAVGTERKLIALEFLDEVRRLDDRRSPSSATASEQRSTPRDTTVTDVLRCRSDRRRVSSSATAATSAGSRAPGTTPATTPPRRSRRRPVRRCGTGSTPTATDNSITRSTSPRSHRSATTPPAAPTTCANNAEASRRKEAMRR